MEVKEVKEVKERKFELSREITKSLNAFELLAGCKVTGIDLIREKNTGQVGDIAHIKIETIVP